MNFKLIAQLNNLRAKMTDAEIAAADAFRDASDAEKELLVQMLQPQAVKKPRKKRAAKSAHQQSLSNAIKSGRSTEPLCSICGHNAAYEDHFKPSPNYHKFDVGKLSAASAGAASSANGEAESVATESHVAAGD